MLELFTIVLLTLAIETKGFSTVDVLTVEQRREIFGTNSSLNLPPIELVTLQKLSGSQQRQAGKRPHNVLKYKLTRNGQEIPLTLSQNADFLSSGCFVHHHGKNGSVNMRPCGDDDTRDCFYTGHSESQRGTAITANACRGLKGMISLSRTSYVIAPLHPTTARDHDNGTHVHVVYRYHGNKTMCKTHGRSNPPHHFHVVHRDTRGVQKESGNTHRTKRDVHQLTDNVNTDTRGVQQSFTDVNRHMRRVEQTATSVNLGKRSVQQTIGNMHRNKRGVKQTRYIDARVVVDPSMYEFHGDAVEDYVYTLFNIASSAYDDDSIDDSVKLVLTEIHVYKSYDSIGVEITADANRTLTDMCSWLANNITATSPDCTVMLTRKNIAERGDSKTVGLARPFGMCQTGSNCAIVEDIGPASGTVMAHEIGHLLGMLHDENTACDHETGIMTKVVNGGTGYTWSNCSVQALQTYLSTSGADCLLDQPKGLHDQTGIYDGRPLPGTLYDKDQQCKLLVGKKGSYCAEQAETDMDMLCSQMKCRKNETTPCADYSTRFADGTDCNNTRSWCLVGKCVAMDANSTVLPVDGGWTDWDADYSQCSRKCGGGLKIKRRNCTNPTAQFGGKYCVGDNVHAVMCNMQRCQDDFKAAQCSELNNRIVNGSLHTWTPTRNFARGADNCQVRCVTSTGSHAATLDGKDGTVCSLGPDIPYGRCIDGKCRSFGCDGVMKSGKVYDRCGICNGSGQGCREVSGNYSVAASPYNFTTVQVIPKDSFAIEVRQHTENCFLSAAINGRRIFNDSPVQRHSNTFVVDDVTFKYNRFPERLDIIGPTIDDIEIQVYSFSDISPPHVQYEYRHVLDQRILQYTWATIDGVCSKTCGTGISTQIVQCVDYYGPVEDYLCSLSKKPNERPNPCNTLNCPPEWHITPLGKCSKSCGPGGLRKRRIYCAEDNNGKETLVHPALCHSDGSAKPESITGCSDNPPCYGVWKAGNWSRCSKTCGVGLQERTVDCYMNINDTVKVGDQFCIVSKRLESTQNCLKRPCYPNSDNCTNETSDCPAYGQDVCYGQFQAWAGKNCRQYCGICSARVRDNPSCRNYSQQYGAATMCAKYSEWAKLNCPSYCKECGDAPQCADFRQMAGSEDFCKSDTFREFANKNCRKMCKMCGDTAVTNTGRQCVDTIVKCAGYGKSACHDPNYIQWMRTRCARFCEFC